MFQRMLKTSAGMYSDVAESPIITTQNHLAADTTALRANHQAQGSALKQIIELKAHDVYKFERTTHVVKVIAGTAWITLDGRDYIVESGQEILLHVSKDRAVISSPNGQLVLFEVR